MLKPICLGDLKDNCFERKGIFSIRWFICLFHTPIISCVQLKWKGR